MQYILQPNNYDLSDPGSIPNLFLQTLELVVTVMLISIILAIPIGLLIARHKRFYLPIITVSALLYTIPSIAAFVLLIPITGFSPATAIIPLVLYNMLVLIRNTAAAVTGIDPLFIEVGRAMGMKRRQVLFRVTFPLALPVIVAGIRIATVTTIGISSLAALVGQGGLGELIFQNIVSGDYDAVVAGAILIACLAVAADLLLLVLQTALNRGRGTLSIA